MSGTELVTTIAALIAIASALSGYLDRRREGRKKRRREPIELGRLVLDQAASAVDLQSDLFDNLLAAAHRLEAENEKLRAQVATQSEEITRLYTIIGQLRAEAHSREGS